MIYTSSYTHKSAKALGKALGWRVVNSYTGERLLDGYVNEVPYNFGATNRDGYNNLVQMEACINKHSTIRRFETFGVLVVPHTFLSAEAQNWLDSDRIVVNRLTLTGSKNEGLEYSYKGLDGVDDKPLNPYAQMWTRYVNHTRELRVYVFKHQPSLVFEKVLTSENSWEFKKISMPPKLKSHVSKAKKAFDGMVMVAFDVLECVTGDFYFLEANSAPSLLVHHSIIPQLVKEIQHG